MFASQVARERAVEVTACLRQWTREGVIQDDADAAFIDVDTLRRRFVGFEAQRRQA